MKFIKSHTADSEPVNLYYEDWGVGHPVVLIHGWPLDHQMWESQILALVESGSRVITYDRRGFGKSDKPWTGYDYDTMADDLKAVLDHLELENVTLVGFSMGGGEVVRYFSRHGGSRVSRIVLVSSVVPLTLKTYDNPDGVPQEVFDQMKEEIRIDRAGFLTDFAKNFYGVNMTNHPVGEGTLNWNLTLAMQATLRSTLECVTAFSATDFRSELESIQVPTLIIHGEKDQTVPIKPTSEQAAQLIRGAEYIVYEDAPHGLFITHKDKLNADLIKFIHEPVRSLAL